MSWVEGAGKLLQDFVAPELRGINQRLDDVVSGMQRSFAEVERLAVERQQASEGLAAQRQQASDRLALERQQASEKFIADRQSVKLDRMESLRRGLLLAVDLTFANRKIYELEARSPESSPH